LLAAGFFRYDGPVRLFRENTLVLRLSGVALTVLAACLLLYRLGDFPLEDWDEASYAAVIRELLRTGDQVTMHYNQLPYYNKPPLYFWLGQFPMRALGFSEFSSRLPGAIFGGLALAATVRLGSTLCGSWVGLVAGLLMLCNAMFLENASRHASPDSLLLFCTVAAIWAQWESRRHPRLRPAVAALAAAAFMTKGAAALSLWATLALLHVILKDHRRWIRADYLRAAVIMAAIVTPWYVAQTVLNGEAFWRKHLYWSVWQRAVQAGSIATTHIHGPLYYVRFFAEQFKPAWPLALPIAAWLALARPWRSGALQDWWRRRRAETLTLAVAALVPLALFSAAQNKAWWYALPALPPLCISAAWPLCAAARDLGSRPWWARLLTAAAAAALAVSLARNAGAALAAQIRSGTRSYGALSQVARAVEGHAAALGLREPVLVFSKESPTLCVYAPFHVTIDPEYIRHLRKGKITGRRGEGVLLVTDPAGIEALKDAVPVRVLEEKGGAVLAWVGAPPGGAGAGSP
jgi:4-amino-4-deoxy-L-arabinose transferase-like glycosyltransferase